MSLNFRANRYVESITDPKTGKYTLSHHFRRWLYTKKTTIKMVSFMISVPILSMILGIFLFGWEGNASVFFAGAVSITIVIIFIHWCKSSRRHYHHRSYGRKPPGASFQKKSNLDADPEEVDRRFKEMKGDDFPEGT